MSGSMNASVAAALAAALNSANPQQIAALSALLSGNSQTPLMQLAGQLNLTPEQIVNILRAAQQPQPGTGPQASIAVPGAATNTAVAAMPSPAAAPNTATAAPSVAALQDQLRQAEKRLRELEEIRTRDEK